MAGKGGITEAGLPDRMMGAEAHLRRRLVEVAVGTAEAAEAEVEAVVEMVQLVVQAVGQPAVLREREYQTIYPGRL